MTHLLHQKVAAHPRHPHRRPLPRGYFTKASSGCGPTSADASSFVDIEVFSVLWEAGMMKPRRCEPTPVREAQKLLPLRSLYSSAW